MNSLFSFLKYMKKAKKDFIKGFVLILFGLIAEIYSIKFISKIFGNELENIDKNLILSIAIKLAVAYLFVKIFEAITLISRKFFLTRAANTVYMNIQRDVYDHIQKLPISYFDNIPAGSVLARITSDVNQIKNFFSNTFIESVITLIKFIVLYSILLYIDIKLSLIMLIFIPIIIFIQKLNKKVTLPYFSKERKENSKCSALANEMLQNLEIIKTFNMEKESILLWEKHSKNRRSIGNKLLLIESFILHNAFDFIRVLVNLIILFYFIYSTYYNLNWISSENIVIFLFYMSLIVNQIQNIISNLYMYSRAKAASNNLNELLNLKVETINGKEILKDFKADIKFKNVYFAYKDDDYVLKNINLEIKENETVAFVGHTGSGKSTIMNLLVKFYANQKGNIDISGNNLKDLDNEFIRDKISIVLQDSFLFEGTLRDNLFSDDEKAIKSLNLVGASYLLEGEGLNSKVLVDGSNFSTGEKQLISFARALAKDPRILILDEATSNIDSKTEEIIQKGIEVLRKGRTTLIIAHRLSTIRNVDRIYVLDKGEIKEVGNHEELIKLNGIYKQMLDRDLKHK